MDCFFTEDLWDLMVKETNLYARQISTRSSSRNWVDVTRSDVQKYVGLRVFMGFHVLTSFRDYWASNPMDGGVVLPPLVMSRDKFESIQAHLHFSDNSDPRAKTDKYWKLKPVIEILDERFRSVYVPTQKVCIDESLYLYRGRHHAVQFIPTKRSRYGLKVFKLCESNGPATGYTSAFSVYMGGQSSKPKKKDQLISYKQTMDLLERANLLDKNYILYTDNWYTSPALFHDLQARKTAAVGTVNMGRKFMPSLEVDKKKQVVDWASSPTGMLAISWFDSKRVNLLSTMHRNPDMQVVGVVPREGKPDKIVKKPQIILDYNLGKTGVDVSDQNTAYYQTRRKCVKWYQTLFWHLVDQAIVNAFLVWKNLCPTRAKASPLQFRKDLIGDWFGLDPQTARPRLRMPLLAGGSLDYDDHISEKGPAKVYRKCKWCSSAWKTRKDTRWRCAACHVYLCPGHCQKEYHKARGNANDDSE